MTTRRQLAVSALAGLWFSATGMAATTLAPPLSRLRPTQPARQVDGLAMARADGSAEDLASYRGRLVVLNVWGSWCVPCRDEMPTLARLAVATADMAIAVLPLAIERRGAEAVVEFFRSMGDSSLPVRLGDGNNIASVFGAWGLPFTVLIDAHGREFARAAGPARWDDPEFIAWLKARLP